MSVKSKSISQCKVAEAGSCFPWCVSSNILRALRALMRVMSSLWLIRVGVTFFADLSRAEYCKVRSASGKYIKGLQTYREGCLQCLVRNECDTELWRTSDDTGDTALEESSRAFFCQDLAEGIDVARVCGISLLGFRLQSGLDDIWQGIA